MTRYLSRLATAPAPPHAYLAVRMLSGGADVVRAPGVSPLYDVKRQSREQCSGQSNSAMLIGNLVSSSHGWYAPTRRGNGGARRDRTDDLKLAKLPLSQLSYGPSSAIARVHHKDGGPGKI
jgi:hypothetical protein